jgi:hypothetical protein
MTSVNISYLIPYLRLKLGDLNPATYRYLDVWLETSLALSIKNLQRFWRDKYLIDDDNVVTRNSNYQYWVFDEGLGTIEASDEYVVVLMAGIIILGGSLENSAWDAVSWRDNEVSYSSVTSGSLRENSLKRLHSELESLITSPTKRLAQALRAPLPGFLGNPFENSEDK